MTAPQIASAYGMKVQSVYCALKRNRVTGCRPTPRSTDPKVNPEAAAAIKALRTFREHAHRVLRPATDTFTMQADSLPPSEWAFWPTMRGPDLAGLPAIIINCQRCGARILPSVGWWCEECDKVVWWLQQERGWSMRQIAASGEEDPSWRVWIQDHAPWLLPARIEVATEIHLTRGRKTLAGASMPMSARHNRRVAFKVRLSADHFRYRTQALAPSPLPARGAKGGDTPC